jgi:hypothetical protein
MRFGWLQFGAAEYFLRAGLRFGDGAQMHFAQEALRALGDDHGYGMSDILRG